MFEELLSWCVKVLFFLAFIDFSLYILYFPVRCIILFAFSVATFLPRCVRVREIDRLSELFRNSPVLGELRPVIRRYFEHLVHVW